MKVRINGVIVVAVTTLGFFGGCSSDNSPANSDAGGDGVQITLGTGGAIDARSDLPADVGVDHSVSGSGGAPGSGGAGAGGAGIGGAGTGGALGIGGALGMGGALGTGGATSVPDASGDVGIDTGAAGGAAGTGGTGAADAGAGGNDGGGGATAQADGSVAGDGAVDAPAATLTQIWSTILTDESTQTSPACVGCHEGSDPTIPDYTSKATTYATLVGVPSTSCPPGIRVTAGNPATSVLVNKLRAKPNLGLGVTVCGGNPMPFGNRTITLDQLHMVESWINSGAPNN